MNHKLHRASTTTTGQVLRCAHCKLNPIDDGDEIYDGCIGKLEGDVMNACCGHGEVNMAYIQSTDGECVRGQIAIQQMKFKVVVY